MNTRIIILDTTNPRVRRVGDVRVVCDRHLSGFREPVIVDHTHDDCDFCTKEWYEQLERKRVANERMLASLNPDLTYYLAGPMTGLPNYNRDQFWMMEHLLKLSGCRKILTPARYEDLSHPYEWYMHRGLKMVLEADALIMLQGWGNSNGACLENLVAINTGRKIYHEQPN